MRGLGIGRSHPPTEWRFHSVSVRNFVLLSFTTMGLYNIFWFYRHWKREEQFGGGDIMPLPRAIFAKIMAYSLFDRIRTARSAAGLLEAPSAGALAFAYFSWLGLYRLPDPYWLVSLLSFLPLVPVQIAANELNQTLAPDAPLNDRLSRWEIMLIVLGGIFVLLAVLGTIFPPAQPIPTSTQVASGA